MTLSKTLLTTNVSGGCYNNNINKNRKIKMDRRYSFGGFSFGSNGLFQLTISTISPTREVGTTHTMELGLELTPEERQELITLLIQLPKEDN
jgi:hypothetical protein